LDSLTLIFQTHSSSRYSVAALLGAVETDSRLVELRSLAPTEFSIDLLRSQAKKNHIVVAYSLMSTQTERVYNEVREIRAKLGDTAVLIAGGAHPSAHPAEVLEAGFDHVVIGEGERVLPEFLWRTMTGDDPESIPGLVSSRCDDCPTPNQLDRVDLDEYPPFAIEMNVVGPVEVTRGCPFSCKFCATPFLTGGKVRHRSVESVVKWLELAVDRRGFKRTWFLSPNALCYGGRGRNVVTEQLERLLKETTSIAGLEEVFFGSFPSEVRPEFVSEEVISMMRSYVANKTLQIGLQSGSDRILRFINRHHTVQDGLNAVEIALDNGFLPHVDMIFGLPDEIDEDVRLSIELCHSLVEMGAQIHGHVFMPLPGSAFEHMPPGQLDESTRSVLGELSRRKLMTGSWSSQEEWAKKLAQ
jgi:B12-binding domain/radical SAM domain protein